MAKKEKHTEKKTNRFVKFFVDSKNEIKKIVWPTIKATFKNTGVVLSAITVSAVFVGALDFGLTKLLSTVMSIVS